MGHPQGPAPLQSDNKCAHGILTGLLKQKQSKGMDMKFYSICTILTEQKQLHTHCKHRKHNLREYPTSKNSDKHHRTVSYFYVTNAANFFNK